MTACTDKSDLVSSRIISALNCYDLLSMARCVAVDAGEEQAGRHLVQQKELAE